MVLEFDLPRKSFFNIFKIVIKLIFSFKIDFPYQEMIFQIKLLKNGSPKIFFRSIFAHETEFSYKKC